MDSILLEKELYLSLLRRIILWKRRITFFCTFHYNPSVSVKRIRDKAKSIVVLPPSHLWYVWSFITLLSPPSDAAATVFSSSLQNAERASSEGQPRAQRPRPIVGLYRGAVVLLLAGSREGWKTPVGALWPSPLLFSPQFERLTVTTGCMSTFVRLCPTVRPLKASGAVMSRGLYNRWGSSTLKET